MSKILPGDIDVLVTSFGGVGTTLLTRFVAQYKRTNHFNDADFLKHLSVPPCSFNPHIRYVYLMGDPILAVVSLFRRKLQYEHSKKLQTGQRLVISPIPGDMSLDSYVMAGKEQFLFESHFENWYRKYLLHPTAFVRYESLWENLKPLFAFLDLPASAISAFPEKKERESSLAGIAPETLRGLEQMYGGLRKRLEGLSDFEVRAGRRPHNRAKVIFSKNMRLAISGRVKRNLANFLHDHYPGLHQRLKTTIKSFQIF